MCSGGVPGCVVYTMDHRAFIVEKLLYGFMCMLNMFAFKYNVFVSGITQKKQLRQHHGVSEQAMKTVVETVAWHPPLPTTCEYGTKPLQLPQHNLPKLPKPKNISQTETIVTATRETQQCGDTAQQNTTHHNTTQTST